MVPAEIIEIEEERGSKSRSGPTGVLAKVEILGLLSEVNIQLIEEPRAGDYVLVHAGCAINKIDKEYFEYLHRRHRLMWEEPL